MDSHNAAADSIKAMTGKPVRWATVVYGWGESTFGSFAAPKPGMPTKASRSVPNDALDGALIRTQARPSLESHAPADARASSFRSSSTASSRSIATRSARE